MYYNVKNMTDRETRNNFDRQPLDSTNGGDFFARNKLVLTLTLTAVSLLLLGVQILPYFYGGSPGHYHSPLERCGWPYGHCKI